MKNKITRLSRRKFLETSSKITVAAGAMLTSTLAACGETATPAGNTAVLTPVATGSPTLLTPANSAPATAVSDASVLKFPRGFVWGVGTSAYQIEGAAKEDGKGESIWDRFCATPGKVYNGDTGAVACDHYHRWEQDLDLMKELGLQSYRFSIAWTRIVPEGSGAVNQKGLDFYKKLVEGLHKRGISPMATLYHWDLPQALEDNGGWANRDVAPRFAEYAQAVFKALADQVPFWLTLNEPWVVANVGYAWGTHAPGKRDAGLARRATHHQLLAHGLGVQAFRALNPKAQIGIALNTAPIYPASNSEADAKAALMEDATRNRVFLDPVFKSKYPDDLLERWYKEEGVVAGSGLNFIKPDDLKLAGLPIDFLGLNYYAPVYVKMGGNSLPQGVSGPHPRALLDWEEIYPQGLYDHLVRLKKDYNNPAIYISENGAAFRDSLTDKGEVDDAERLKFLQDHFASAHQAITQGGVNLKGYYVWSLMDNFEWAEGYRARFGIVYVDYANQKRYPKRSALWYKQVIQQNGLS